VGLHAKNRIPDVNYYEILELPRTASQDEVKAAYKKMASVVHPDKGGSAMLFRLVKEAYEVLSDPIKRKQHDSDLAGSSGGNRQATSQNNQHQQQQQSQTSDSETNYVRAEDLYKRWKEDRNRVAMPRAESYAAGGVRKMIRESALALITSVPDPKSHFQSTEWRLGDVRSVTCGNCGFAAFFGVVKLLDPLFLKEQYLQKREIEQGQNITECDKCKNLAGALRVVKIVQPQFSSEEINVIQGDYLYFENGKFLTPRSVFGMVVEGSAKSELGLRSLKVLDEFTGRIASPKNWWEVWGSWKSNDLAINRNGSMRNWSF
jgi:hypothetical protein